MEGSGDERTGESCTNLDIDLMSKEPGLASDLPELPTESFSLPEPEQSHNDQEDMSLKGESLDKSDTTSTLSASERDGLDSFSMDGDQLSIHSRRSSTSTPSKPDSGPATPTEKDLITPPPTVLQSNAGSTTSSESGRPERHPNRPNRPGITWKEGARLEAKDFLQKWYPARLMEIDDSDNTVLVHFDGWNQRYDEWMSMDSDRIRPMTRHSERKDKARSKKDAKLGEDCYGNQKPMGRPGKRTKSGSSCEHKIGDNVFAKWTDCRMYAGTIVGITPNGCYDVLFYDGFKKLVQPMNVKTMSMEVQMEYAKGGILPTPTKKPKQKLRELQETLEKLEKEKKEKEDEKEKKHPGGGSRDSSRGEKDRKPIKEGERRISSGSNVSEEKTPSSSASQKKPPRRLSEAVPKPTTSDRTSKTSFCHGLKSPKAPPSSHSRVIARKRKLVIGGTFQIKKLKIGKDSKPLVKRTAERSIGGQSKRQRRDRKKVIRLRKGPGEQKSARPRSKGNKSKKTPGGTEAASTHSEGGHVEWREIDPEIQIRVTAEDCPSTPSVDTPPLPDAKTEESAEDHVTPAHVPSKKRTSSGDREKNVKKTRTEDYKAGLEKTTIEEHTVTAPKAFRVEEDHNKYKCPYADCNKAFRKLSLVEYHIKYYHTSDGKVVQPIHRKRQKTISTCSTDSEVSVGGSKGSSRHPSSLGKKKRESSMSLASANESSLLEEGNLAEDGTALDLSEVETRTTTTTTEEAEQKEMLAVDDSMDMDETMDRLTKDEVVNCICQLNEENGLMIQCDVCLCWQHALCMEISEETLPSKYICYVCANPPGVRDSARFSYDHDWLKHGTMARFNFLPEETIAPQKAQIMQATHELVADMHGIQNVLRSTKCKLLALKEPNHPEVSFWTENWDLEIERQRQQEIEMMEEEEERERQMKLEEMEEMDKQEAMDIKEDTEIKLEIKDEMDDNGFISGVEGEQNKEGLLAQSHASESIVTVGDPQEVNDGLQDVKHHENSLCMRAESPVIDSQDSGLNHGESYVPSDKTDKASNSVGRETTDKSNPCSDGATSHLHPSSQPQDVSQSTSHTQSLTQPTGEASQSEQCLQSGTGVQPQDPEVPGQSSETLGTGLESAPSATSISSLSDSGTVEYGVPPVKPSASGLSLSSQDEVEDLEESGISMVTIEEDPFANCERNLLEHISNMHDSVEGRLDLLEEQVQGLESADDNGVRSGDILRDMPRVKKVLHQLLNDLVKVKRMALFH